MMKEAIASFFLFPLTDLPMPRYNKITCGFGPTIQKE